MGGNHEDEKCWENIEFLNFYHVFGKNCGKVEWKRAKYYYVFIIKSKGNCSKPFVAWPEIILPIYDLKSVTLFT